MKTLIKITYFSNEDVLFIPLKDKTSSVGDEDYQEGVVLFRDKKNEVVAIEIQHFSTFKKNKISICDDCTLDLKDVFLKVRMLISCRDIYETDPLQLEETLKEWGMNIKKDKKEKDLTKNIHFEVNLPEYSCQ